MSGRRKGYLKEKRGTLEDAPFFVTTQHPIENFSLIKHKLDFAYFHHHYKLFND